MAFTQKFREQHDELLVKAGLIGNALDVEKLKEDGGPMRSLLSDLLGKLKIHLAVEDKALYPQLKNCGNHEVVAISIQYQEDMGGIAEFVAKYSKNWPSGMAISENAQAFIDETNQLLSALGTRIQKENDYLYKLADECL
jgi:iron-sulfur cluster repair protein YtfE (RIC family)